MTGSCLALHSTSNTLLTVSISEANIEPDITLTTLNKRLLTKAFTSTSCTGDFVMGDAVIPGGSVGDGVAGAVVVGEAVITGTVVGTDVVGGTVVGDSVAASAVVTATVVGAAKVTGNVIAISEGALASRFLTFQ